MTIALTINGQTYDYPETDDEDWGPEATDWAQAVTVGMLQKAGGLFTLLDEVDFGATFGLKSVYFKSRSSNVAAAGVLRLANTDVTAWRNFANDGDLLLGVNASDQLTFNGSAFQNVLGVSDTSTINLTLLADVLSADVVAGSIGNTELATGINVNKLAALTVSRAVVSDASGFLSVSAATSVEVGYLSGVSSAIQTQLNSKLGASSFSAKGDLIAGTGAAAFTQFAVGTDGQVLTANSANATGLGWSSPLTNPMNTAGDIIVGGVAGAANRLGIGAANTVLKVVAGTPGYGLILNANVDPAAAIAYSKLTLTGSIVNADISASAAIAGSKVVPTFGAQDISNSGNVTFVKAPISTGSVNTVASANYTITDTDGYAQINVTTGASNRTITLPSVSTNVGRVLLIKKMDSGAGQVIIDTPSTELIDGAAQNHIMSQYGFVQIKSDGTNWSVVGCMDSVSASGTDTPVSNSVSNLCNTPIPEGKWVVSISAYNSGVVTGISDFNIGLSTSASPTLPAVGQLGISRAGTAGTFSTTLALGSIPVVLTALTTHYLPAVTTFSGGTFSSMTGRITANRVG